MNVSQEWVEYRPFGYNFALRLVYILRIIFSNTTSSIVGTQGFKVTIWAIKRVQNRIFITLHRINADYDLQQ